MTWLANLLGNLKSTAAVDYTHFYVETGAPSGHITADSQYVRVWLRAARVTDVRRWNKKIHATVHARFTYTDRAQGEREVVSVVAPDKSFEELDPKNLDRLIVVNQPLFGPVPYRGKLAMEVALFSVEAADLAKPYLQLLADLTNAAGVGFLNQAAPFVEPIRRGAELLFNSNGAQLEIGLARSDVQLRVGDIVVARVPKTEVDTRSLRLDPHDFGLIDQTGRPVTSFPYMVLGVEATAERDDYARIPDISDGWEAVRRVASEGRSPEEVRQRLDALKRAIWLSPDLVQSDKKRIVEIFGREIADAGFDVAPPAEARLLEDIPGGRPLREATVVLSAMARRSALESVDEPARISMERLQEIMRDPDYPDDELQKFFTVQPHESRPFAPSVIPDPSRVEIAAPANSLEGAMVMTWANGLCRLRRQEKFRRRRASGDRLPVLVSEGDSWFQFPIFLEDVIDQLAGNFNIWSVDSAGDTLQNMILDNAEYMQALRDNAADVRAFLFSGGGNDLVGEDGSGRPIIGSIVREFEAGRTADWYLATPEFDAKLRFIEECYRQVIDNVMAEFPHLPIICHGYDRSIPGGSAGDARNPMWARQDQWIGRVMREELGITEHALQRQIVALMIDQFNLRLKALCGGNNPGGLFRNAWHVDARGFVNDRWADELHPKNEGYRDVAFEFLKVIGSALRHSESAPVGKDGVSPNLDDDAGVEAPDRAGDFQPGLLEARNWRLAASLDQLRRQINALAPRRNTSSDGSIGDAAHENRNSDHNPWVSDGRGGVVTALDITHDPNGGCDAGRIADALRASRDSRIKYLIWNGRILSAAVDSWNWRPYTGSNPHSHHIHISVQPDRERYDSDAPWVL